MPRLTTTSMVVAVALLGCAGGGAPDAGGLDAGLPLHAALLLDAIRGLGGFELPCAADGGQVFRSTFQVPLDGGSAHFEVCRQGGQGLLVGNRVPSGAQLTALRAAVEGLERSSWTGCGADKATLWLDVTTPAQVFLLADSFYACQASATGRTSVDHLDEVFQQLDLLTQP
jgi:hypothetical protein